MTNVSGPLLPSNNSRILQPVETPYGVFQVRVIAELDTHGLFVKHSRGETLLAIHGNGFSCFELLHRVTSHDINAALEQAHYIRRCGGLTCDVAAIEYWASPKKGD